ncbi:MAG TPA: HAD family hydrolase [Candidatus Methylomirabilis sp.]|nr:HAD family hydrolase [Candidatus Methylomirabilis sp.]
MPAKGGHGEPPPIGGILFDMDGVVVRQQLDFLAIKREIFGTTEGYILERMAGLPPDARVRAESILERHETAAAMTAEPMDGILPFLQWMEARGLRRGIVTRNSRKSVELVLRRLGLAFDAVVTREDAPPKPAPEPVWLACRRMELSPAELVFVGDFEFDMLAGRRANVRTVLLRSGATMASEHADLSVDSLEELRTWLEATGLGVLPKAGD